MIVVAQLLELRNGEVVPRAATGLDAVERNERVWIGDVHLFEKQVINKAEYGGVGSDAEGQ